MRWWSDRNWVEFFGFCRCSCWQLMLLLDSLVNFYHIMLIVWWEFLQSVCWSAWQSWVLFLKFGELFKILHTQQQRWCALWSIKLCNGRKSQSNIFNNSHADSDCPQMMIPVMSAILDATVRDSVILICYESMMKSMWNEMTSLCGVDDDDDVFVDHCDGEFRQSTIVSKN